MSELLKGKLNLHLKSNQKQGNNKNKNQNQWNWKQEAIEKINKLNNDFLKKSVKMVNL